MRKILRLSPSFIYTVSNLCAKLLLLGSSVGILFLATVSLITIILAAWLAVPSLILLSFGLISLVVFLISLNVGKNHYYSVILYLISLCLLFGTTLTSNYLIGSDIHIEYYFARLTQLQRWD